MAHCANCGCEIPSEDRTRLCDSCKRILLPFVKFMDASTSAAVPRLIRNEKNLRNAGATDSGMEYVLRLCELHDRKRQAERDARETPPAPETPPVREPAPNPGYEEIEIPFDEPLNLHREAYGKGLPAAEIVCWVAGAACVGWFAARLILNQGFDLTPLAGGAASFAGAYAVRVFRKALEDLEEIKRHFR